jgi:hypothetical protein
MVERRPRAPVLRSIAFLEIAQSASSASVRSTLSISNNRRYFPYMIARVITAAFERIALPTGERNPAFLVVDEAAEYFDENLETMLSQARKFNVGVLFAHQHLDQLTPALRAAVAANTSIKLAGGVSDKDARALAPDMRTTSEFIAEMRKLAHSTEFACFVRNSTGSAVRLQIPFGALEKAPRMSPEQHAQLITRNHQRYATIEKERSAETEAHDRDSVKPRRKDPDSQ